MLAVSPFMVRISPIRRWGPTRTTSDILASAKPVATTSGPETLTTLPLKFDNLLSSDSTEGTIELFCSPPPWAVTPVCEPARENLKGNSRSAACGGTSKAVSRQAPDCRVQSTRESDEPTVQNGIPSLNPYRISAPTARSMALWMLRLADAQRPFPAGDQDNGGTGYRPYNGPCTSAISLASCLCQVDHRAVGSLARSWTVFRASSTEVTG